MERYSEKYNDQIQSVFDEINKYEDDIRGIDFKNLENEDILTVNRLLYWKLSQILDGYLKSGNGFLGNDMFLVINNACKLLLYELIIINEQLSKEEQKTCELEIEMAFYFLLNCIYNAKEKFNIFTNFKKENNTWKISDSILKDNNLVKSCENKLSDCYKNIKEYCDARNDIVHNNYSLNYDKESNSMKISCFSFDLSQNKVNGGKKKKVYSFLVAEKELIKPIMVLQRLRKYIIEIISDLNNIDMQKYKSKYVDDNGGFSISF